MSGRARWAPVLIGALWIGVLVLAPPVAATSHEDPIFVFPDQAKYEKDVEEALKNGMKPPEPPYFESPCGLGVASGGKRFYVSEYYPNDIKGYDVAFNPNSEKWEVGGPGQEADSVIKDVGSGNGPCALAFSSSENLYVNEFHQNVLSIALHATFSLPTEETASHLPTGIAIDPATNRVYVDNRTYVSVFNANGTPVMEGGEPLRIGTADLKDGYGVAIASDGRVYVADAGSNVIRVYNPVASLESSAATTKGPGKGFSSLRDSAIAIDRGSGTLYVVDNLQPVYTEEPQAVVDVFSSGGAYLGVLKYRVNDGLPPGLAVDNSQTSSQGRVYVTSGNTDFAALYAYDPGSETVRTLPPSVGLVVKAGGSGNGAVTGTAMPRLGCQGTCSVTISAGTSLNLAASAREGSRFVGWSGDGCSGAAARCTVSPNATGAVIASFERIAPATAPPPSAIPGTGPSASLVTTRVGQHRKIRHRRSRWASIRRHR